MIIATFESDHPKLREVLARGDVVQAVATFSHSPDAWSTYLRAIQPSEAPGTLLVYVVTPVRPETAESAQPGTLFKLFAGRTDLGHGVIIRNETLGNEDSPRDRTVPSPIWQGSLDFTLWEEPT